MSSTTRPSDGPISLRVFGKSWRLCSRDELRELIESIVARHERDPIIVLRGCERCESVCISTALCKCCTTYNNKSGYPLDGKSHLALMPFERFVTDGIPHLRSLLAKGMESTVDDAPLSRLAS